MFLKYIKKIFVIFDAFIERQNYKFFQKKFKKTFYQIVYNIIKFKQFFFIYEHNFKIIEKRVFINVIFNKNLLTR